MSQSEFAESYHINLYTLRSWEQNKKNSDSVSLAYLSYIEEVPELIKDVVKQAFKRNNKNST